MRGATLTRREFIALYGGIYEHSPWVAEESYAAYAAQPEWGDLASLFARTVDAADEQRKLALIRAHPDLAGRAAVSGTLTAESQSEQASAGIDQCSAEEYERFQRLNENYWQKFAFPFVMAVRDSNRRQILSAFAARLDNDHATEFATALAEIHKIAALRLNEIK